MHEPIPMHWASDYRSDGSHLRPCWTCTWWDGMCGQGSAIQCALPGGSRVKSEPERACAFWEREPGSDDEKLTREVMEETWRHLVWPEPSLRGGRISRLVLPLKAAFR